VLVVLTLGHALGAEELGPDIVVAADGSGGFKAIQAALDSIPKDNHQRVVILIKDGVYREKVRIDAHCVTLRGQSRKGTRIEFPQFSVDFNKAPDSIGRAIVNINGDDVVLENLTAANTAPVDNSPDSKSSNVYFRHAITLYGNGDRTITLDCDLLSDGADTVSLWRGDRGRYYHARCHFRGGTDFVCPRGWCYITDCTFDELRRTATLWHDGSRDRDQKLVVRHGRFGGVDGWLLGRHHADAQFYLLDCHFSDTMADRPVARVRYDDPKKDEAVARNNRWGERCYYHNCHREGDDFAWFRDNLASAEGSPTPDQVTAAWTFGGTWDPETHSAPTLAQVETEGRELKLTFNEDVTVKGKPRLLLEKPGTTASHRRGTTGGRVVVFEASEPIDPPASLTLEGGAIIASVATVRTRHAELKLPAGPRP